MNSSKKYFQLHQPDLSSFIGQFILTRQALDVPLGWTQRKFGRWLIGTNALPLHDIHDERKKVVGICIGFPQGASAPWRGVDDFYHRTAGRWILLLEDEVLYLDPSGSLSAVYSDTAVASSATLLEKEPDWDTESIAAIRFPEIDSWFPFGLTARRRIKRLLPNHCLDLATWKPRRHWPAVDTDLSRSHDPLPLVEAIVNHLRKAINEVPHPLSLALTAGRDSRMLLACCRDRLDNADFFTFDYGPSSVDVEVGRRLAMKFGLTHRLLPMVQTSDEELTSWLYRTGHSVSGPIWKIHKTLNAYSPDTVNLPGLAGEVGRAYYWRRKDRPELPLLVDDVLSRTKQPKFDRFREEARTYLDGLKGFDTFVQLDLLYIEQRLGCWASPSYLGNTRSKYEFTPFNQRQVFTSMMRLPCSYRRSQYLARDVCRIGWSELESMPFNECSGRRWLAHRLKARAKGLVKYLIGR